MLYAEVSRHAAHSSSKCTDEAYSCSMVPSKSRVPLWWIRWDSSNWQFAGKQMVYLLAFITSLWPTEDSVIEEGETFFGHFTRFIVYVVMLSYNVSDVDCRGRFFLCFEGLFLLTRKNLTAYLIVWNTSAGACPVGWAWGGTGHRWNRIDHPKCRPIKVWPNICQMEGRTNCLMSIFECFECLLFICSQFLEVQLLFED